jgi:hypothetical protein
VKICKQPLLPDRIRRPPREGWSWIDRRFVAEQAPRLERDAILLYFFLAAVSDKHGLSYYGDGAIAERLRMTEGSVGRARAELEARDLIAYRSPLYQVLSISIPRSRRDPPSRPQGPSTLADIFRVLAQRDGSARSDDGRRT